MTLKHTMTLTDDQANLIYAWAAEELKSPTAVAAAYVIKSLIDDHLHEWVANKWEYDLRVKQASSPAPEESPVPEEDGTEKCLRAFREKAKWTLKVDGEGYFHLFDGVYLNYETFIQAWQEEVESGRSLKALWGRLQGLDGVWVGEGVESRWTDSERRMKLSQTASKLRKHGVPLGKMKRGRRGRYGCGTERM